MRREVLPGNKEHGDGQSDIEVKRGKIRAPEIAEADDRRRRFRGNQSEMSQKLSGTRVPANHGNNHPPDRRGEKKSWPGKERLEHVLLRVLILDGRCAASGPRGR